MGLNSFLSVLRVAVVVVFCLLEGVDVSIIAEPGKVFAYLCLGFVGDNAIISEIFEVRKDRRGGHPS